MLFLEQFLERPILLALVELATERDRIACLGGLEEGDWLGKQRCGVLRVSMGADIELHASVYHFCGGCAAKRRLRTAILCPCVHARGVLLTFSSLFSFETRVDHLCFAPMRIRGSYLGAVRLSCLFNWKTDAAIREVYIYMWAYLYIHTHVDINLYRDNDIYIYI
jgi:hypothetical protein